MELAANPEWLEVESVFVGCNTRLDRLEQLIVGLDEHGEFVAVLAGPGLGQPDTARCLIMAIQALADGFYDGLDFVCDSDWALRLGQQLAEHLALALPLIRSGELKD